MFQSVALITVRSVYKAHTIFKHSGYVTINLYVNIVHQCYWAFTGHWTLSSCRHTLSSGI